MVNELCEYQNARCNNTKNKKIKKHVHVQGKKEAPIRHI